MSDFSEMCPLFSTGVYNELHIGRISTTLYTAATMNFLNGPCDIDTAPTSFSLGRTVVVTNMWVRRIAGVAAATLSILIGRQSDTGTAPATIFGTLTLNSAVTAFPDIRYHWNPVTTITSFTVNSDDYLFVGCGGEGEGTVDVIVQYREK